jgi:AraC-like DNA-binding protein
MANMASRQEVVARQALGVLSELAAEQNLDFAAFRISAGSVRHMWTRLIAEVADPALGLHLGELFGPMVNTVNTYAFTTGNPRLALDLIATYWTITTPISRCEVMVQGELTGLRYLMLHGFEPLPADVQFRLTEWVTMLRWMSSEELSPVRIACPFSAPPYADEFRRIFRCPIDWNQPVSEVWYRTADLDMPSQSTPRVKRTDFAVSQSVPAPPFPKDRNLVPQLKELIGMALATGESSLRQLAPKLGMTERSLFRKLQRQGIGFRDLVEDVQKTKAAKLLAKKQHSITEIASLLGYSNPQNFTRAYRRWYGVTPRPRKRSVTNGS